MPEHSDQLLAVEGPTSQNIEYSGFGAYVAPKTDPYAEIGSTGLPHYGGMVYEEILPELQSFRWRKVVRQMIDNDATIGAMLFAIEMFIRQVQWDIHAVDRTPEAEDAAAFARGALFEDMEHTWPDTLSEILTMLPWGWAFLEVVFKPRQGESADYTQTSKFDDGRIGFAKWSLRSQESLHRWVFDEAGRPLAMIQSPAPSFTLREIPLDKGLLFRTTSRKSNPEGRSVLRTAYSSWYIKTNLERIEAIGVERDLNGLPVARIPGTLINSPSGSPGRTNYDKWKKIVTNIKMDEQQGVLIPSDRDDKGNFLYELSLLTTGGQRMFDTDKIIQRYDQRIAMSVLADFILIGHTARSGSYGLSENKSELFSNALGAWLDSICATINRHALPKLMSLNNLPAALTPRLDHGKVHEIALKDFGDFVSRISGVGVSLTDDDVAYIKQRAGLPLPSQDKAKTDSRDQHGKVQTGQKTDAAQEAELRNNSPRPSHGEDSRKNAVEPSIPSKGEIAQALDWLDKMLPPDSELAGGSQ